MIPTLNGLLRTKISKSRSIIACQSLMLIFCKLSLFTWQTPWFVVQMVNLLQKSIMPIGAGHRARPEVLGMGRRDGRADEQTKNRRYSKFIMPILIHFEFSPWWKRYSGPQFSYIAVKNKKEVYPERERRVMPTIPGVQRCGRWRRIMRAASALWLSVWRTDELWQRHPFRV